MNREVTKLIEVHHHIKGKNKRLTTVVLAMRSARVIYGSEDGDGA